MDTAAHKDEVPGAIRVAARALIIEEGRLLVMTMADEQGQWCVTPGGGVRRGETLGQGLRREVREEIGIEVTPDDIVYVRELIGSSARVRYGGLRPDTHQLEIFFHCRRRGEVRMGATPDSHCTGFAWVPLKELAGRNFFPEALAERLARDVATGFIPHGNYLGDA
ncbi:MAG: NUDIX domain-containing protein [Planctomycetes bacterium]|jgi:ADP-ribose pyrophosphatase YjhB (NUDIX family)|nr:NUDIX domain-containing protein [Planctomycetota bacterium]MCL4729254.1 NUDIX domain-containing protein [Planctomycetota bacterium]